MGSGDWFKTIICRKKTKQDRSKPVKGASSERSNGFKWRNQTHKASNKLYNGVISGNHGDLCMTIEDIAATRIQTAFRGFRARKALRHLKGVRRLQALSQGHSVKKQASTTLSYLQSWSKIQTQIRTRRACMVTEDRIRQKKQDNQLRLDAKLHDLEVEWCGGSETMVEILARIQQRETAAIKRERAMAYAFSHQWRANSGLNQGQSPYDFGKGTSGWSWMERWIAARPWETRLPAQSVSPNKSKSKPELNSKIPDPSARILLDPGNPVASVGKSPTAYEKAASEDPSSKSATSSHPKTKNAKMNSRS